MNSATQKVVFLTLVHKNVSRTKTFMSLYNAFLNAINYHIKRLTNKPKRSDNIYNILKVASWASMSMNATDGYILLIIEVTVSDKQLT